LQTLKDDNSDDDEEEIKLRSCSEYINDLTLSENLTITRQNEAVFSKLGEAVCEVQHILWLEGNAAMKDGTLDGFFEVLAEKTGYNFMDLMLDESEEVGEDTCIEE
jgi:hypothetical protein